MRNLSRSAPDDRPRILLSEGASTSARQAITALALTGYEIEICDPDPFCLGRFSALLRRFHRCPGLRREPERYLGFILDQISTGRFDILLPIHEQGLLFAKVRQEIAQRVSVALPSFEAYEQVLSKTGFSRLLAELDLPQPATTLLTGTRDLKDRAAFPFVLKTAIGTASRGTWIIADAPALERAVHEIEAAGAAHEDLLMQELVAGPIEHAQAVFCQGRLAGLHLYRQLVQGAGGGPALKESIRRPMVQSHLARIGERLCWHGALSVDYILDERRSLPLYIDCNPRLVEPMSALLAGADLADLLVRVSRGETPPTVLESREGVRTHMAIQALFGCAMRGGSRWDLCREGWRLLTKRGAYSGSREELTPVRLDWLSAVPAVTAGLLLIANPKAADVLARTGWGDHLLSPASIRTIREEVRSQDHSPGRRRPQ